MKITDEAITIVKESESYRTLPYLCPAKVATIGYGTTVYPNGVKVSMLDQPLSIERATAILMETLNSFGIQVSRLIKSKINDNQYSACVSLAYNIGIGAFSKSTLLKKINANPNDESIFEEFLKWNKGGGKVLNGLVIRRNKEAQLYFKK